MKLFIKEHRLLIIVQIVQLWMIGFVIWLGGFQNILLILYALFLGVIFLFVYLVYKYNREKRLYKRLSSHMTSLDESQRELGNTYLATALSKLLQTQYELYEREIIDLKQKQDEQFIFIDRWIHQMKTPLSVIELIAIELDEPESSSIREEVDRMKTGLQTSLHMARLRAIDRDFHVKKVNINEVIDEVNEELKRLYIRNGIYPKMTAEHEEVFAYTDEKWFYFIMTQLIQNAVKYSAQKSNRIQIRISKEGTHTIVEVEDGGIGIPEADIKRIFDPFFTGQAGRHFRESTGVGLYLVKEVADYLEHRIEVESELGQGSIFRIIV